MPFISRSASLPICLPYIRRTVSALLVAATALICPSVSPAEPLSSENLTGFDGIITHCVSSTDKKYAITMCDALVADAKKQAEAQSLGHAHLGTVDWTAGGGEEPALPGDLAMTSPLHLAFYIRGTDGNPAGASATAQFFVPYTAAIENGSTPREGRLVIWQDATLGSGPPKATAAAVAGAVGKKMGSVFDALAARPKHAAD